jgi:hypothetical protein
LLLWYSKLIWGQQSGRSLLVSQSSDLVFSCGAESTAGALQVLAGRVSGRFVQSWVWSSRSRGTWPGKESSTVRTCSSGHVNLSRVTDRIGGSWNVFAELKRRTSVQCVRTDQMLRQWCDVPICSVKASASFLGKWQRVTLLSNLTIRNQRGDEMTRHKHATAANLYSLHFKKRRIVLSVLPPF